MSDQSSSSFIIMDQYVSESLREYLGNTSGPMILYNTKWFATGMFSLAVSRSFFFFLPGEQTTIIDHVHQSELNNEIKINLPN